MKATLGIIGNLLLIAATGLIYLVLIFPATTHTQLLVVRSGSMVPTFMTGDAIIVRQPDGYFAPDMIITFAEDTKLITHRIIDVFDVDGAIQMVTQGDANDTPDSAPVSPEQVRGVYTHRIPYLGYIAQSIRNRTAWVLLVVVPAVALVGMETWKLLNRLSPPKRVEAGGKGHEA